MSTVIEIIKAHLEATGKDGLFDDCLGCACEKDNLAPCDSDIRNCRTGYRIPCDCGDHDWHIGAHKEGAGS